MTQQPKSGEMKGSIENFEHLKPGEGVDGYEYGSDLQTEGAPLIDPGTGEIMSIRLFEFKMNPEMVKHFPTDRQELFNAHAKQILTLLWADGLIPFEDVPPRVIIDKKKRMYRIFIPSIARRGNMFMDNPKSLSEQLKTKNATPRHQQ